MASTTLRRRLFKTPMRDLVRGRITGRLDIEQLLEDSGLSGPAAIKVRKVVKRTRLWRLEKVDVAHELIAHFLDGREAGTPMDELLESFGDETRTAKLIRRAKKRQRPYVWHAFAWARLALGLLFGLYLGSALYLLAGSPTIKTNYVAILNQYSKSVPEAQAAWPLYRQAMLDLDLWQEREWDSPIPYYAALPQDEREDNWEYLEPPFTHSRWDRLYPSLKPSDPGWQETATFLFEHEHAFALIREAADKPGLGRSACSYEDLSEEDIMALRVDEQDFDPRIPLVGNDSLLDTSFPYVWGLPSLSKLMGAEAIRHADNGNNDLAYQSLHAIMQMLHHADELPTVDNGRVAMVLQIMLYDSLEHVLTEYPDLFSDAQLQDLAHMMASISIDPERWFTGEKLAFYDTLQRVYTDDGHGGGHITREGIASLSVNMPYDRYALFDNDTLINTGLPIAVWMVAPRDEVKQIYDQMLDENLRSIHQPIWKIDSDQPFMEPYDELITDYQTAVRYAIVRALYPQTASAYVLSQTVNGLRHGALVGIALELYRRNQGRWPDALAELTPTYLPDAPVDPFTGKPMGYTLTDHGPVVYSVGCDRDDDGGQPPVDQLGEPANWEASPSHFRLPLEQRSEQRFDGDWVLWPVPYED